jgi:hypothetical protein
MNSLPRMLQALFVFAVLAPVFGGGVSAQLKTRNVILITTDGLRWEEVFGGAESALMNRKHGGVENTNALRKAFWRETPEERRQALMPFLWSVIAKDGQILGNKTRGSVVKVSNGLNFSYPGYNEILTGIPDPRIDSNDKKPNPNVNVLEWLNQKAAFKGRVAAFCAWDVFPYILNREQNRLLVRAGWEPMAVGRPNPQRELLNQLVEETTPMWEGVIYDSLMFHGALDYFKEVRPRVFYLAFGETDDWAHEGRYDHYLRGARRVDGYLKSLWETVQSMPEYRGKTTFLITTDHGRGSGKKEWKDHGKKIKGSEYIWLAAIGPDTPALGERTNTEPLTQSQVAATVAALLGEDYHAAFPRAGGSVRELMSK